MTDYYKEIYETLLRIENLLKNLGTSSHQEQTKEIIQIKRHLSFDKNKLTEFKEEREKLRKIASFKCYWNREIFTWVFDGEKNTLEKLITALQQRGIPMKASEVAK